ncbi:hypothetical protein [Hyphomicrobium sulfonivorans]|uniref:hypothetical protein n=1 Tax=Hyphomicrobium sulfonivorans TaxID=121290 RepID=UPI000837E37B|nr:hypothetical protein [Hyphomicrobium sulfonivorans]
MLKTWTVLDVGPLLVGSSDYREQLPILARVLRDLVEAGEGQYPPEFLRDCADDARDACIAAALPWQPEYTDLFYMMCRCASALVGMYLTVGRSMESGELGVWPMLSELRDDVASGKLPIAMLRNSLPKDHQGPFVLGDLSEASQSPIAYWDSWNERVWRCPGFLRHHWTLA